MELCNRKIDVHAHLTSCPELPRSRWHGLIRPDELLEKYRALGVEKGLLLPLIGPEALLHTESTDSYRRVAQQHPDSFYFAIGIDPRMGRNSPDSDLTPLLSYYQSVGARAVGELTANLPFDHPLCDNLFEQCANVGLPVTFHLSIAVGHGYGLVDEPGLPRIERILKKYPRLQLVGHSQIFWAHLSADVTEQELGGYPRGRVTAGRLEELMERYGNLYCDLSAGSGYNAMSRDEDYAAHFLRTYSDRVLFGLDIYSPDTEPALPAWLDRMYLEGRLDRKTYLNVCRNNAVRLYRLPDILTL